MQRSPNKGPTTLRTDVDFKRVFAAERRLFRDGVGFYFRSAEEPRFRYAIIASKRFGIAVDRNRLRRRLRELIRGYLVLPIGIDLIICVYKPCKDLSFGLLKKTLKWAFEKINREIKKKENGSYGQSRTSDQQSE